jgi:HTH-type transcriptional regulator/antitoxin HipB
MKQIVYSPESLGQFIQRVRRARKLTQRDAGLNFKLDQTTISSIEQGARGTRIETLFRLLAALDLELVIQHKKSDIKKNDW